MTRMMVCFSWSQNICARKIWSTDASCTLRGTISVHKIVCIFTGWEFEHCTYACYVQIPNPCSGCKSELYKSNKAFFAVIFLSE